MNHRHTRLAIGQFATVALAALVAAAFAADASATVIVDWGGNYVSSNRQFQNFTGDTTAGTIGGFSSGDPLLISPSSGYSGGDIYGSIAWTLRPTQTENTGQGAIVKNASPSDQIELKMGGTDYAALLLWRQSDFLNGMNTGTVTLENTSTAAVDIKTYVGFDAGRVVIRLEGGSNDGYYISQETPFDGSGLKSASLTSLTWLSYDPATSLTATGSVVNLLSSGQIANVTEAGIQFEAHTDGSNALRFDSFEVDTAVIPEPATLGLIVIGGMLMAPRRRNAA